MKVTYEEKDDILVVRLSNKPIVKESSQDWDTHISYAEDGSIVEVVVIDASQKGAWPLELNKAA